MKGRTPDSEGAAVCGVRLVRVPMQDGERIAHRKSSPGLQLLTTETPETVASLPKIDHVPVGRPMEA